MVAEIGDDATFRSERADDIFPRCAEIDDQIGRLDQGTELPRIILHGQYPFLTTCLIFGRKTSKGRLLGSSMSLNIKNLATVALADELARRQGVSKTAAIHQALSERLRRLGYGDNAQERLLGELRAISERVARLPELVARDDEEIVGYDEHGIPT